jgi:hypothetical protein
MNLAHPKNLEVLRGEYDKLGTRIARLAFIRTTLFVLFVFSLASAFQAISSHDASGIVDRIRELMKITKDEPELSYFLKAIYFPRPGIDAKLTVTSPMGEVTGGDQTTPSTAEAATSSTPTGISAPEKQTPSAAELEELTKAKQEQANLVARLTTIANEAFTFAFKAPLLGTEIKLDMRIWGFILPFCFIFWEVYLAILRHKLRTLHRIASVIAVRTPKEATVLDHVLFRWDGRRSGAFSSHPAQFEFLISLIFGTALIVYLCIEGHGFWEGAEADTKRQLIELYGFVVVYAASYGAYVRRRISAQADDIEGFERVTNWAGRALAFVRSRLSSYVRRLWPEVNLATGSTMIIGTLWLLVGAPSGCEQRTGWGYLHHADGWLVGPVCGMGAGMNIIPAKFTPGVWHMPADWHNSLIAALYAVALAVAGVTLVLLLISLARRRRIGPGRSTLFLSSASTVMALFFLTELAVGQLLDIQWFLLPLWLMPLWLIPIWIFWRYAYSKRGTLRAAWPSVRKSLFYWYAPQAAVGLIVSVGTLFEDHPLVGVPVFVCGLAVLALGYWNARALAGREASQTPSATRSVEQRFTAVHMMP